MNIIALQKKNLPSTSTKILKFTTVGLSITQEILKNLTNDHHHLLKL